MFDFSHDEGYIRWQAVELVKGISQQSPQRDQKSTSDYSHVGFLYTSFVH